jgi:hypothetical protein
LGDKLSCDIYESNGKALYDMIDELGDDEWK